MANILRDTEKGGAKKSRHLILYVKVTFLDFPNWSELGDSDFQHLAPKRVSELSGSTLLPSLNLSAAPAIPL